MASGEKICLVGRTTKCTNCGTHTCLEKLPDQKAPIRQRPAPHRAGLLSNFLTTLNILRGRVASELVWSSAARITGIKRSSLVRLLDDPRHEIPRNSAPQHRQEWSQCVKVASSMLIPGCRMTLLVDLFQLFDRYMSIKLCGGNTGMPQHFLNLTQASSIFQHQRRRRVPPKVVCTRFIHPGQWTYLPPSRLSWPGASGKPFIERNRT